MSPRLLVLLLCLVNLVAGVGLGVAADRTIFPRVGPRRGRPDMAAMLEKRLDLDAAQARRVRELVQARHEACDKATHDVRPQLDAIRAQFERDVRALLRPDQLAKYDDLKREFQQRHDRGAAAVDSQSRTEKEGVR